MEWKEIAKSVSAIAPTIGAAIGGPAGSVVGMGVQAIAGLFGIKPDAPDAKQQLNAALESITPEQAVKLKELDQQFAVDMKKLDVDVYKLEVKDRDSARKMRIETSGVESFVLASLIVCGWIWLNYFIITAPEGIPNKDIIMRLLGTVDAAVLAVIYFFFGGAKKHKDKI